MKLFQGAAVLCAACLILTGAAALPEPAAVYAAEEEQPVYQGMLYETAEDAVTVTGFTEDLPEEITVPSEIGGLPVTKIGAGAFRFCMTVTAVTLPDSITEIGDAAFKSCYQLKSAVLPANLKTIPDNLFYECWHLESVNIPAGLERIGETAFAKCESLAKLELPDTVTEVGESAFSNTKWIEIMREKNPFVIVNHVLIDGKACTGDITIPADVTAIGASAFSYNHNITNVAIPENVTEIRNYGIFDCNKLETVTILNPACEICDMKATVSNHYARHEAFMLGTIRGCANSTAQAYAEKYGCAFEAIEITEMRGDFNGDCRIGADDAQNALNSYVRTLAGGDSALTDTQKKLCDINGDGAVDVSDAQLVLMYYVKNTLAGMPVSWEELLGTK